MPARKNTRSYSRKLIGRRFLESYANDRMLHQRVCLHFYASLTVMQAYHLSRVVREHRCSRPFAYVRIHRRAHTCMMQVPTYGQPVAAQFLRKFPPRLPKLTPTVNHSLRKVHASPNRSPIYDAKRTVISIFTIFLKFRALTIILIVKKISIRKNDE